MLKKALQQGSRALGGVERSRPVLSLVKEESVSMTKG